MWEDKLSECQIRDLIAVSAAGLQGKGLRKRSACFTGTDTGMLPVQHKQQYDTPWGGKALHRATSKDCCGFGARHSPKTLRTETSTTLDVTPFVGRCYRYLSNTTKKACKCNTLPPQGVAPSPLCVHARYTTVDSQDLGFCQILSRTITADICWNSLYIKWLPYALKDVVVYVGGGWGVGNKVFQNIQRTICYATPPDLSAKSGPKEKGSLRPPLVHHRAMSEVYIYR